MKIYIDGENFRKGLERYLQEMGLLQGGTTLKKYNVREWWVILDCSYFYLPIIHGLIVYAIYLGMVFTSLIEKIFFMISGYVFGNSSFLYLIKLIIGRTITCL